MTVQLTRPQLDEILQADDLGALSGHDILRFFRQEEGLRDFLPDGICRQDPRDGSRIIFNSARAKRPHHIAEGAAPTEPDAAKCPVCNGKTTGVLDVAPLSEGFTFINKNLFPILYPWPGDDGNRARTGPDNAAAAEPAHGFHFLQWTSSLHDQDWHNMPTDDRETVVRRLAVLEEKLLFGGKSMMLSHELWDNAKGARGFVAVIKNYGKPVGGSLAHGHQQIAFSNIMPKMFWHNLQFLQREGRTFAEHMLADNPGNLTVKDYGAAVLMVPSFMRRPYNMMLILKDTARQYVCELSAAEIRALADALHDAVSAILRVMPDIGRTPAYNITLHNGPGAGLYLEFLPYTQETGGFEHLGLWVCQNNPRNVAEQLRDLVA